MFEKALIRRSVQDDLSADIGLLAETLLFYRHVHWVLDQGSLSEALRKIGPDNFMSLLDNGHITATYIRNAPAVYTDATRGIVNHSFVFIELRGKEGKKFREREDLISEIFTRAMDGQKPSRKLVKRFLDKVPFRRLADERDDPAGLKQLIVNDANDGSYVHRAMRAVLRSRVPHFDVPDHWTFTLIQTDKGFVADTNYDFAAANREYHRFVPPEHSSITPAFLLCTMLDARTDIFLAADYMSEIVTDPWSSSVMSIKFNDILKRRRKSDDQIEAFQELTLNNGRALREAINSGQRTFTEFLRLLDESAKFKEWLSQVNPDVGHLTDYYRRICENNWLDLLPVKLVRFSLFSAAGAGIGAMAVGPLGTGLGLVTEAVDAFLVDRLLRGWAPNKFIRDRLEPFVRNADQ